MKRQIKAAQIVKHLRTDGRGSWRIRSIITNAETILKQFRNTVPRYLIIAA